MDRNFSEPTDWVAVSLAFAVWGAHFSVLWAASSVLPGDRAAQGIALGATMAAFAALVWLWRRRAHRAHRGHRAMPRLAYELAGVAILFGALPAIIG